MKHSYSDVCQCARCGRERVRREQQSRAVPHVMLEWTTSRNPQRARIAREYWDAYESGRPMSDDNR